jgi:hypothetical protein
MKQTAVEWVLDWMSKNQYFIGNDLLKAVEEAKEMEKEQMCLFVETFEYEYFKGNVSTIDEHYDKTFNTNEK